MKLNELVAEHLDGWKWQETWNGDCVETLLYKSGYEPNAIPDYAGDITAAWQVVEKVKNDCECFAVIWHPEKQVWHVTWRYMAYDIEYYAVSDNVCLAICIAALRAIGVSQDKIIEAWPSFPKNT